jgi:hypothetical protein
MRYDKQIAKDAGVPPVFRRYAARYGAGVESMLICHKQNPVPMLDHARDRKEKHAPQDSH